METLRTTAQKLLELLGLGEPSVTVDEEGRRISIFVNEGEWFTKEWLPWFVADFERVLNLIAKKQELD